MLFNEAKDKTNITHSKMKRISIRIVQCCSEILRVISINYGEATDEKGVEPDVWSLETNQICPHSYNSCYSHIVVINSCQSRKAYK